jgi:hypothetical protein
MVIYEKINSDLLSQKNRLPFHRHHRLLGQPSKKENSNINFA